jgi:hypothetical protein
MELNELRIGNYIAPLGKGITQVEGMCTWDSLIQSSNFAERGIEDFEPIQLTEEWLFNFGFISRKESEGFYYFGYGKNPITYDWMLCLKYFKDENRFFFMNGHHTIKYIHQLQNLYFVLTGEELKLNK